MPNLIIMSSDACNESIPLYEVILIAVGTVIVIVALALVLNWLLDR